MRLLITGAAGFVGSNLAKEMEQLGHEVISLDRSVDEKSPNLEGFEGQRLRKSIGEIGMKDIGAADVVLHEAAISDPTVTDEKLIMETNFTHSLNLIKMCKQKGIPIVYASSSAVYGNSPIPNREFVAEAPHNAYARSKLMLDLEAKKLMGDSQIVGLRYFNIYGKGEKLKGKTASIIYHFVSSFLGGKGPVIYGDGTQKRDFVYVRDIVSANLLAIKSGKSGIVNVGSGKAIEFNELAQLIGDILKSELKASHRENPYKDSYQYTTEADISLAKSLIGYNPKWDIRSGIEDYIRSLGVRI